MTSRDDIWRHFWILSLKSANITYFDPTPHIFAYVIIRGVGSTKCDFLKRTLQESKSEGSTIFRRFASASSMLQLLINSSPSTFSWVDKIVSLIVTTNTCLLFSWSLINVPAKYWFNLFLLSQYHIGQLQYHIGQLKYHIGQLQYHIGQLQ